MVTSRCNWPPNFWWCEARHSSLSLSCMCGSGSSRWWQRGEPIWLWLHNKLIHTHTFRFHMLIVNSSFSFILPISSSMLFTCRFRIWPACLMASGVNVLGSRLLINLWHVFSPPWYGTQPQECPKFYVWETDLMGFFLTSMSIKKSLFLCVELELGKPHVEANDPNATYIFNPHTSMCRHRHDDK